MIAIGLKQDLINRNPPSIKQSGNVSNLLIELEVSHLEIAMFNIFYKFLFPDCLTYYKITVVNLF